MTDEPPKLTENRVLELYRSGELTEHVFSYASLSDEDGSLSELYVDLHNRGEIDFLSLLDAPSFGAIASHSFFNGQHVFCDVIPKLKASTGNMMRAVDLLVRKGGEDLAANQPNGAFRQWCQNDLNRAKEVIASAKSDNRPAATFLSFALEAGAYFDEAKDFVTRYTGQRRLSAIAAISRMKLQTGQVEEALAIFLASLNGDVDDLLFANVLYSSFEVSSKHDIANCPTLRTIVVRVSDCPGPQVHYVCSQILWAYSKFLSADLFSFLAGALASLDPSHKATVRQIDSGLRNLLDTPLALDCIELLRSLLVRHSDSLELSEFSSFGHKLLEESGGLFQKVLVEWLVSGEPVLCEGLSRLLGGSKKNNQPISLSPQNVRMSTIKQIFLSRKAIGYFFLQPVFAASVLISILRICSDDCSVVIQQLLFDPLLRNYGGKLRDFLSSIRETDAAFAAVRSALDKNDRYLADIQAVGEIRELSPSEVERQTVHRSNSDEVRKSQKEAMKRSVLMSMVHRSVVLYGRRTLTIVQGPDSERQLMEMDLKSHSFGWELPRATIIDPVGLDFIFRVFRAERLRDEAHPP
jgi:hypothetical protein